MSDGKIKRRDFLKTASLAPLAYGLFPAVREAVPKPPEKSKVVLVRDKNALTASGEPDEDVIGKMLDEAVCVLTGKERPPDAWNVLVRPEDVVGIKTNVWKYIPTTPQVEQALKRRIMNAGVAGERIAVEDRGVLGNEVFRKATAFINARPARTHHWAGMGSLIKNYITFTPDPWSWHADACADLAKIWFLPHVAGRTRLNVLVMLTPLFHGIGPHHFSREYVREYRGLIVSRDPVAADAVGLRIIEAMRRDHFGDDRPMQPKAHHIFLADTRHHLGVSREEMIDLIRIGWNEGALI